MASKRWVVGLASLVASGALLGGCTSGGSSAEHPAPTTSSPSASPTGPVTLRVSVYGARGTVAAYQKVVDAYHHAHRNVTIDLEHSVDAETADQRLQQQLTDGSEPDVFLADHDSVPALVLAGDVQPVDQLLEQRDVEFGDDYQRAGLEAFSADSSLQCMPDNVSPLVVFYNRDLLNLRRLAPKGQPAPTTGTGWTWDQFASAARNMSRPGVEGVYIPPTLWALMPLVRSGGADVVDNQRTPTTLTMDDSGTRAVLEQVLALVRRPGVAPAPAQLVRQSAISRFEHGKVAMMLGTRSLVPQLRRSGRLSFDVFPLPSFGTPRTISQTSGLCISARTPHVDAAADFITFAVGNRGAAITARTGAMVPSNLPALHSPSFTQPLQQPASATVFSDGVAVSESSPFVPSWTSVLRQTQPFVDEMFFAPTLNLDTLLPRMDRVGQRLLSAPTPSASASP